MKRIKKREKPQILSYIIIALMSFVFLYPVWHTVVLSFSDRVFAMEPGFKFWPRNFSFDSYKEVFSSNTIFVGYMNTLIRTVVGTLLTLVATFCMAYAMSDKKLPGWSALNFIVVFTMFFSGGTIPAYLNMKGLGLLNTRWAVILPMVAGAWNFIIMRNYITGISREMREAAEIDGASVYQSMLQVVLPLCKPVIAVIGLWSVVNHWNAWFDSMLYAGKSELTVLQVVVRRLIDQSSEIVEAGLEESMAETTSQGVQAATVVIATLPILLAYPFIQKYLVKGTMVGAVKG